MAIIELINEGMAMISAMSCDVCGSEIKGIQRLGQLGPNLATPGRFEHLCPACKYKIDNEVQNLQKAAEEDLQGQIKHFIERLHENPRIAKGPKKEA